MKKSREVEVPPDEALSDESKESMKNFHPDLVVRWDTELKILVDEQGIMYSRSTVEYLIWACHKHLKEHSPLELEALGRRTVERHGKGTALQFNFDMFKEESGGFNPNDKIW